LKNFRLLNRGNSSPVVKVVDRHLCIGGGNATAPGTFFSGLIDDVQIYNRAVSQ